MQKQLIALLSLMSLTQSPANACTDFQLKTKGGDIIIGRSMEWGIDLKSQLRVHPRSESHVSEAPNGKTGTKWQSKYGYIAADANGQDLAIDGMNEKGLSSGALWMPGFTTYQTVASNQSSTALSATDLGHWILGNFATVDEVKANIGKVRIWCKSMPEWGGIPTMHLAVHDAKGNNVVIEFVDGQQKIYDNPNGVLTNAPPFDWHLINLRNYMALKPANPEPVEVRGTVLSPPGQGQGFLGAPGDWTPPSRFVRTTAMVNFAKPVENASQGVNLAEHILNAVDIPLGDVRAKAGDLDHCDYTQWILIKDLKNSIVYFRSYENLNLRSIDLKKLDLNQGAKVKMIPMFGGEPAEDVSGLVKWRFVPDRPGQEPVKEEVPESKETKDTGAKKETKKEPKAKAK